MENKSNDDVIEPEIVSDAEWEQAEARIRDGKDKKEPVSKPGGVGTLLHPMSGILVIALDYLCFGGEITGILIPVAVVVAFVATFIGVYIIQRNLSENPKGKSLFKAFICGVITAFPLPIFGTVLGSVVLAVSGLQWFEKNFKNISNNPQGGEK